MAESLRSRRKAVSLVLVAAAAVTVFIGVLLRVVLEEAYDPMWARAAVVGGCLGLAVATHRGLDRPWRVVGYQLLAVAATVWAAVLLWGNGFPSGPSSAVLVVQAACVASFPSVRGGLTFAAFFAAAILLAGWFTPDPATGPVALAGTSIGVGLVLVASFAHRTQLARALGRSRDNLEAQVLERTAALEHEVAERRDAEIRALTASQAKSRFLSNMSHELRTPLNAILGYAELAAEEVADALPQSADGDDLQRQLHAIGTAAGRLLAIVDDVLELTRIDTGDLEIRTTGVDLGDVIQDAVATVHDVANARNNVITTRVRPDLGPVCTDPVRLGQILVNLLSNAARFTEGGRIEIHASTRGDTLAIVVEDSGIGIPDTAMPTLFERFTQVDDSTTRTRDGTGLGLALSRDLAHRLGGELTARSRLGEGSAFTLVIPRELPRVSASGT